MKLAIESEVDIKSHQAARQVLDELADLFDAVADSEGFSRTMFAERIGRDPAYLTRILNGRVSNFTFQTIARMYIALGYWPELKATPLTNLGIRSNFVAPHVEMPNIKYAPSSSKAVEGNRTALPQSATNYRTKIVVHTNA